MGTVIYSDKKKINHFKVQYQQFIRLLEELIYIQVIEEKAANLLYLITKNHSFTDGNKRIAAFLFLYFLERNGILFDKNGKKRIADNTLVALTLMIAVSKPDEKIQ